MADGAYDEEVATALELIEEAGQVCEWRKEGVVPDDADRPWLGGNSEPQVFRPPIAFLPATITSSSFGLTKFRAGEDVASFSTFGLMGAQDFEPKVTDVVLRDGRPLVIAAIDEVRPAEQVVLYILSIV